MAYHNSFKGHNTGESLSGCGFHSISRENGHCGQERSSGEDTAVHTHRPSAATVPCYNSSNHVTCLQNATDPRSNHLNLANHFKNLNAANILHCPSLPSSLPPPPPPQAETSRTTFDAMQSPYHIGISYNNRSYQQYPISYGLEASTSQHKLPENFGYSMSQFNASQYDGGATSRKTSGFDGYGSDGYGLGGENNYESSDIDMELESDPEYPPNSTDMFSPMEDHHHYHHHTFHPHHPSCDEPSSQRFTPSSESEWNINVIDPESDISSYPWRSAGKEHWQRSELPETSWRHAETGDYNSWLHSFFYPLPSDKTTVYSDSSLHDNDVRNTNTPSDISSSASPLSPIDGLTYPVSQFPPIVASSSSTQAPYPYSCHQLSGIGQPYPATGVYEPAVKSNTTTSAPFITSFLNGNGFASAPSGITAPDPVLHAPRPVRPIPTVSFEDLAASISNV